MDRTIIVNDWLALIGEIGIGNAEIAALYKNGTISFTELTYLIGPKKAEKVREIFESHVSEQPV